MNIKIITIIIVLLCVLPHNAKSGDGEHAFIRKQNNKRIGLDFRTGFHLGAFSKERPSFGLTLPFQYVFKNKRTNVQARLGFDALPASAGYSAGIGGGYLLSNINRLWKIYAEGTVGGYFGILGSGFKSYFINPRAGLTRNNKTRSNFNYNMFIGSNIFLDRFGAIGVDITVGVGFRLDIISHKI